MMDMFAFCYRLHLNKACQILLWIWDIRVSIIDPKHWNLDLFNLDFFIVNNHLWLMLLPELDCTVCGLLRHHWLFFQGRLLYRSFCSSTVIRAHLLHCITTSLLYRYKQIAPQNHQILTGRHGNICDGGMKLEANLRMDYHLISPMFRGYLWLSQWWMAWRDLSNSSTDTFFTQTHHKPINHQQ